MYGLNVYQRMILYKVWQVSCWKSSIVRSYARIMKPHAGGLVTVIIAIIPSSFYWDCFATSVCVCVGGGGGLSQYKDTVLPVWRWCHDHLIFIIEISLSGKNVFILSETQCLCCMVLGESSLSCGEGFYLPISVMAIPCAHDGEAQAKPSSKAMSSLPIQDNAPSQCHGFPLKLINPL